MRRQNRRKEKTHCQELIDALTHYLPQRDIIFPSLLTVSMNITTAEELTKKTTKQVLCYLKVTMEVCHVQFGVTQSKLRQLR